MTDKAPESTTTTEPTTTPPTTRLVGPMANVLAGIARCVASFALLGGISWPFTSLKVPDGVPVDVRSVKLADDVEGLV